MTAISRNRFTAPIAEKLTDELLLAISYSKADAAECRAELIARDYTPAQIDERVEALRARRAGVPTPDEREAAIAAAWLEDADKLTDGQLLAGLGLADYDAPAGRLHAYRETLRLRGYNSRMLADALEAWEQIAEVGGAGPEWSYWCEIDPGADAVRYDFEGGPFASAEDAEAAMRAGAAARGGRLTKWSIGSTNPAHDANMLRRRLENDGVLPLR